MDISGQTFDILTYAGLLQLYTWHMVKYIIHVLVNSSQYSMITSVPHSEMAYTEIIYECNTATLANCCSGQLLIIRIL